MHPEKKVVVVFFHLESEHRSNLCLEALQDGSPKKQYWSISDIPLGCDLPNFEGLRRGQDEAGSCSEASDHQRSCWELLSGRMAGTIGLVPPSTLDSGLCASCVIAGNNFLGKNNKIYLSFSFLNISHRLLARQELPMTVSLTCKCFYILDIF